MNDKKMLCDEELGEVAGGAYIDGKLIVSPFHCCNECSGDSEPKGCHNCNHTSVKNRIMLCNIHTQ